MVEARCMKCKKQVEIKKGVCPHCGTKVFRILGKA